MICPPLGTIERPPLVCLARAKSTSAARNEAPSLKRDSARKCLRDVMSVGRMDEPVGAVNRFFRAFLPYFTLELGVIPVLGSDPTNGIERMSRGSARGSGPK